MWDGDAVCPRQNILSVRKVTQRFSRLARRMFERRKNWKYNNIVDIFTGVLSELMGFDATNLFAPRDADLSSITA